MLRSLLPLLACPECHNALELSSGGGAQGESVVSGELACTFCSEKYPVEHGIPRLMPKTLLDAQRDEIHARDTQVEQYDSNTFLNVFGRFEIPKTLKLLDPKPGDLLLEAGCGTGRMTSILSGCVREMVAVDFSFASLCANQAKLDSAGITNVHLAQADVCHLPFAKGAFQRAVSCQVLEHVPGDDARRKAVASIARGVHAGGTAVISAYQHSPLMGKKEGRHDGGIPFFRFSMQEFKELLGTQFAVLSVSGSLVYLYIAKCERMG